MTPIQANIALMLSLFFALPMANAEHKMEDALHSELLVSYFPRAPFYLTDKQGEAHGLLVDKVRHLLKKTRIPFAFQEMPPNRILWELTEIPYPHCGVGWFKTAEREQLARFSLPIYQDQPMVILALKETINRFRGHTTLKELFSDHTLVMTRIASFSFGNTLDALLNELKPRIQELSSKPADLALLIYKKRADYMLIQPEEVTALLAEAGIDPTEMISLNLTDMPEGNPRHLMCSKATPDAWMDRINQTIADEKTAIK